MAQPDEFSDFGTREVQELSVQWLNLGKTARYINCTNIKEIPLDQWVEKIIDAYNKHEGDDEEDNQRLSYSLEKLQQVDNYCLKIYSCVDSKLTSLSKDAQQNPEQKINSYFILFFYKTRPTWQIIAATSGKAFLVVKPCVDHNFPSRVIGKVGNPEKIGKVVARSLLQLQTKLEWTNPDPWKFNQTTSLFHSVESLKCEIKKGSSLSKLLGNDMPFITITSGGILRIEKRIPISDYPKILLLLAKYMTGKETFNADNKKEEHDSGFEFLDNLQPARLSREELDDHLLEEIFHRRKNKQELGLFVGHKHYQDFVFSDEFEISLNCSARYELLSKKAPTIEQIIAKIEGSGIDYENSDQDLNMNEFKGRIHRSKLRFRYKDGKKKPYSLMEFIEGELSVSEISYFKVRNMWYELKNDYFAVLHETFKTVFKDALIEKYSEGWLPEPWKVKVRSQTDNLQEQEENNRKNEEDEYNRLYMETPYGAQNGYLVFDKVTPDGIEPCDILKYDGNTVYLYHVKKEFGQNTRVACSQMLNAARVIRQSLSTVQSQNYLQRLWVRATKMQRSSVQMDRFKDEKEFLKMFRDCKIVFVYVYASKPKNSFLDKLEKFRVTADCLNVKQGKDKKKLLQMLIKLDYLDLYGRLTAKFIFGKKEEFKLEDEFERDSAAVFKQLRQYRLCSKSTLAKMEIVHVAKNLHDLNFEFKICELEIVEQD